MSNLRCLTAAVLISAGGLMLVHRGQGQNGDKDVWQPLLSKEVYLELTNREADFIKELLNGKAGDDAIRRAKFGAVLIAALTKSVKDGVPAAELQATRDTALKLAATLNKKGQLAAAKDLAALLPYKGKADANAGAIQWGDFLTKAELMDHFKVKAKGGDGMHADLQSNSRLKADAQNGVEEKIRALATKDLPASGLKKEARELELLGYRCAVIGELTYFHAPSSKFGKKDPQDWRVWSVQTRDNGVSLAVAAKKGDAIGVLRAANNLNSSCSQCHTVFR